MVEKINSSKEIRALEEKRDALERAVKIALNMERLHESLEASLLLGKSSADIPADALATYEELEASTKALPVKQLKTNLAALEKVVKDNLGRILQISEMDADALVGPEAEQIEGLLSDYRKQTQTAVAMRVLLPFRGASTPATDLKVSVTQIQTRLKLVKKKEQAYRQVIRTEVVAMIKETDRMLANEGLAPAMRRVLEASNEDMQLNLAHLESGKPITTMPIAMEIIEVTDRTISTLDTTPTEAPTVTSHRCKKQNLVAPMEPTRMPQKTQHPADEQRGFFGRLWQWVTTPDHMTWKVLKQETKKPKRKLR